MRCSAVQCGAVCYVNCCACNLRLACWLRSGAVQCCKLLTNKKLGGSLATPGIADAKRAR